MDEGVHTALATGGPLGGEGPDAASASLPADTSEIAHAAGVNPNAQEAAELRAEIADLRRQLFEARAEVTKARQIYLEMDHERGFLRAMLASARSLADQARAECVYAQAKAAEEIDQAKGKASAEVAIIRGSTSWRLTLPVRGLGALARRLRRWGQ